MATTGIRRQANGRLHWSDKMNTDLLEVQQSTATGLGKEERLYGRHERAVGNNGLRRTGFD